MPTIELTDAARRHQMGDAAVRAVRGSSPLEESA